MLNAGVRIGVKLVASAGVSITPTPAVALPRLRPTPSCAMRAASAARATRGREWIEVRCVDCWRDRQPVNRHLIVPLPVLPVWLVAMRPAVSRFALNFCSS
jgi:hypothetical protein